MKNYQVIITPSAELDLQELFQYIAFSVQMPQTARNFVNRLKEAIMDLAQMPERWPLLRTEPWHAQGLRRAIVAGYLIIFVVLEDTVYVLLVVNAQRNVDDLLQRLGI